MTRSWDYEIKCDLQSSIGLSDRIVSICFCQKPLLDAILRTFQLKIFEKPKAKNETKKQEKQEQKEQSGHFQPWLKKEKNIITKFVVIPNSLAKIYKNIYNFSILDIFYKWYGFSLTHTFPFKDIIFDPGKYGSQKTCILTYLTKCFRYKYKKTNLTLHCVKYVRIWVLS